MEVKEF